MNDRDATHAVGRDAGEATWFNGVLVTIKTPGEWSEGPFSLVELVMPQGRATGLHSDPSDETIHVLAGELLVHIDGAEQPARTGDTLAIARGVTHALLAVTERARVLVLNTSGTHDRFFVLAGCPRPTATLRPPHPRISSAPVPPPKTSASGFWARRPPPRLRSTRPADRSDNHGQHPHAHRRWLRR